MSPSLSDDAQRILKETERAMEKRVDVEAAVRVKMEVLLKELSAEKGSEPAAQQRRSDLRGQLLECGRVSAKLDEHASTLRRDRRAASVSIATLEALQTYRSAAANAFALRHVALDDGGRLLSDGRSVGSLSSFSVIEGLGKGSFGAVFLVEHEFPADDDDDDKAASSSSSSSSSRQKKKKKKKKQVLAMKMVARETVASSEKRVRHLEIERRVMSQVKSHPFIVSLHYALQSPAALFFVMDCKFNLSSSNDNSNKV